MLHRGYFRFATNFILGSFIGNLTQYTNIGQNSIKLKWDIQQCYNKHPTRYWIALFCSLNQFLFFYVEMNIFLTGSILCMSNIPLAFYIYWNVIYTYIILLNIAIVSLNILRNYYHLQWAKKFHITTFFLIIKRTEIPTCLKRKP